MFEALTTPVVPVEGKPASIDDGLLLCRLLHAVLAPKGFYPSLTGGLLYKEGPRKDIDVLIFRNRQDISHFEMTELKPILGSIGVEITSYHGFVTKATWNGFVVDLFNPETDHGNEYVGGEG